MKKRHKKDTQTFSEMTYSDQAKSISAQILILGRAIRAHERRARDENRDFQKSKTKCINQLIRLITRFS